MRQKTLLRAAAVAMVAALTIGVLEAQSARRAIGNLLGYTDSAGNLAVVGSADQGTPSARRAIGNLLGRTDSSGNLMVTMSGLTPAQGTITTDLQAISTSATWNAAGVTFTHWKGVITDTASAAASNALQLLGGAAGTTNLFSVRKDGRITIGADIVLVSKLMTSATAPTISSGFGTSPSVPANNGTAAFTINVGTGGTASAGVIGMPTATTGWNCSVTNRSAVVANRANQWTVQTATTTTSVTVQNQTISTGAALAWTASDVLALLCSGY